MRILFWILVLFIGIVLAVFAVANRGTLALELWPLPWLLELPVYLAILGALLLGILIGAFMVWIGGQRRRRELRRQRRRITALEHELAATQAQLAGAPGSTPARVAAQA